VSIPYEEINDFELIDEMCRRTGAIPEPVGRGKTPPGKWLARCSSCGMEWRRHSRPKLQSGWFCQHCGPERGGLVWAEQRKK
jgi:hypothetical protein